MSEEIQIILIICITIVICCGLICDSIDKGKNNNKLHNKIGHNPSPPDDFKKPGFPTYPRPPRPGTKTYDSIINIKPPSK